jgi:polysaccharide export outer membrane protein
MEANYRTSRAFRFWRALFLPLLLSVAGLAPTERAAAVEYRLQAGDVIRITVFQNPDLTTEARVSEAGGISYPLLGSVPLAGMTLPEAEQKIAGMLRDGGFVNQPQVNILPLQTRGNQVAVMGQVNRPGRYPLESLNNRVSDLLAAAGGPNSTAADSVVVVGHRDGQAFRQEIDIRKLFQKGTDQDLLLEGGDTLFVDRAPVFYIYGEVQHPGAFRLERDMRVMQAIATGGGLTAKGTERGIRIQRKGPNGQTEELEPQLTDLLRPDDVIQVQESLF